MMRENTKEIMTKSKTLAEGHEDYFREHPDEIDGYLTEIFTTYAEDEDPAALLSQLLIVARAMNLSEIAQVLLADANPFLENITAMLKAMGYKLTPEPLRGR